MKGVCNVAAGIVATIAWTTTFALAGNDCGNHYILREACPSPPVATPLAYVSRWNAPGDVEVVDTASNAIVASVPSAGQGPIAASAAGTRVYVAGKEQLAIIDTATNAVVATVPYRFSEEDGWGDVYGLA